MSAMNEQHGEVAAGDAAGAVAKTDFEFVVEGATISVALGTGPARDAGVSLERAKLAIARLASLQQAERARPKPDVVQTTRPKQPGIRQMPNVFDYWAYRRD